MMLAERILQIDDERFESEEAPREIFLHWV